VDICITPKCLSGEITPPASKSELHRLLIAAALADGPTTIALPAEAPLSADILATIDCLSELGATIDVAYVASPGGIARKASSDNAVLDAVETDVVAHAVPGAVASVRCITVQPIAETPRFVTLNAKDSASTLRFLMPVASVLCEHVAWVGSDQLAARPLDSALAILREHGVAITETNPSAALPLITDGFFTCNDVTVPGDVSSQYVSGMLFAMAAQARRDNMAVQTTQAKRNGTEQTVQSGVTQGAAGQAEFIQSATAQGDTAHGTTATPSTTLPAPAQRIVRVDGRLVSVPYVALTIDVLRRFGLDISQIGEATVDTESQNSAQDSYTLQQKTKQAGEQTLRQTGEQGTHNPLVAGSNPTWCIQAGSHPVSPGCVQASCDWSNAAPFLALAAYYSDVKVRGLDSGSLQGDQACSQLIKTLVADAQTTLEPCVQESCTDEYCSKESCSEESSKDAPSRNALVGDKPAADAGSAKSVCTETLCIDMQNTPDLFPVLACLAAAPRENERTTRFTHTARLRTKESDRVASTAALIQVFGVEMDVSENECLVRSASCAGDSFVSVARSTDGKMKHVSVPCYTGDPVTCSSAHDHRIVMAATLCAHIFNRSVIIEDAECVAKSYPTFFDDYRALGGIAQ